MYLFAETPTSVYGDSLKQQVEDRLKFYESGETPRKNIEVMQEAMALASLETPVTEKKKKKKKLKSEAAGLDDTNGLNGTNGHDTTVDTTLGLDETNGNEENGEPKKKKKKKKVTSE